MYHVIKFLLVAIVLLTVVPVYAFDKIVVAVVPTASPEQLSSESVEIKAHLEKQLGMKVELVFPTNYAGVIEALNYGHAQIAFMGAWPALIAYEKAEADVILAEIREVTIGNKRQEAPFYYSYWVVNQDNPAKNLNDLKGKKVAFPSQLSTSGYIAPLSRLVELGLLDAKKGQSVDPKLYFSDVLFAGGYAQGWEALKAKQVDVTIIAGDVAEKLYREVLENTRVIETQGPIPSHVVVVARDVDQSLREKIKQAFLTFNQPEYQALMRKFVSGIFVRFEPAGQEHLAKLKDMLGLTNTEFIEKKADKK